MTWNTHDEMVGERVTLATGYGEYEDATVIAVAIHGTTIKVMADDGDILIGNQWE